MSCGLLLTFQARKLQLVWKGTFSTTTYPITLGKWALRPRSGTRWVLERKHSLTLWSVAANSSLRHTSWCWQLQ